MATIIESFVAELGWKVDAQGPKKFEAQKSSILGGFAKIGAAYTAIAGLVTGFVARTNAQTTATYRLSKSLGVSYDWLKSWGDGTKSAGIGIDGIGTAFSFLQKQIGNAEITKNSKTIDDALKGIGLSYKEISGKEASEQFDMITEAIGNSENKAVQFAAASKVFGRNGGAAFAKLAQLAKSEGKPLSEYVNRFRDLEFETDASVRGAVKFTTAFGKIQFAIGEVKESLAGYIGEALAPMLESMVAWIKANREVIKNKIIEWAKGTATWLKVVWGFVSKIGKAIGPLVNAFGGLGNVLKLVGAAYIASKIGPMAKGLDLASIGVRGLTGLIGSAGSSVGLTAAVIGLGVAFESLSHTGEDISSRTDWAARYAAKINVAVDDLQDALLKFFGVTNLQKRRSMELAGDKAMSDAFEGMISGMSNVISWIDKNISGPTELLNKFLAAVKGFFNVPNYLAGEWKDHAPSFSGALDTILSGASLNNTSGYLSGALSGVQTQSAWEDYGPPAPAQMQSMKPTPAKYFQGTVNAPITINAAPGMSEEKVAKIAHKHLEKTMRKAVRNLGNGE
jgi:hypothetical protein